MEVENPSFFKERYPEFFKEIDLSKNIGIDLNRIYCSSKISLIWKCSVCGKNYEKKVSSRTARPLSVHTSCGKTIKNYFDCNRQSFLERANAKHKSGHFDYSKVGEINKWKDEVIIICIISNFEFKMRAGDHVKRKYSKCCVGSKPTKIDPQRFLRDCKEKYGDAYDYSKAEYKGTASKIILICNSCKNEVCVEAGRHKISGSGCNPCKELKRKEFFYNKEKTENFISRCVAIHEDQYDYSKTVYTGSNNYVIVTCKLCDNLDFKIAARSHLRGSGCGSHCRRMNGEKTRCTIEHFIEKSISIHGPEKFDFSEANYQTAKILLDLKCLICNTKFSQTPKNHYEVRTPCPVCYNKYQESKGASNCRKYLTERNINFKTEVKFGKSRKRFDFTFKYKNYFIALEFDGSQHHKYHDYFHKTEEYFHKRQESDIEKNYLAGDFGYNIIRVSNPKYEKICEFLDMILETSLDEVLGLFVDNAKKYKFMLDD